MFHTWDCLVLVRKSEFDSNWGSEKLKRKGRQKNNNNNTKIVMKIDTSVREVIFFFLESK